MADNGGQLFGGTDGGPVSPEIWKRAVLRRPPKRFDVNLLPPEKLGNSYNFGFRIHPIKDDDASIFSRTISSAESTASFGEYDVWRKWEDCLWFQHTLSVEYSRAARDKRNRLAAGKGIKKNGVYIHSDEAASWESLPFGPDPDAIARDIHEYIPKLTKKATIFRASQETIHHRYEELKAMMDVLLRDDLPTLIKEIKGTDVFTDFFGVWRRDIDLRRKAESPKSPSVESSRRSLFALPTSSFASSPKSSPSAKGKAPAEVQIPFGTFTHSDSSFEDTPPRSGRSMNRSVRSRASSSGSRSSSSLPMTPLGSPSASHQLIIGSQDSQISFEHNPHVGARSPPYLRSLPEDPEICSSSKSDISARQQYQLSTRMMNRNAKVYVPQLSDSSKPPTELSSRSLSRYSRTSLQSRHSSASAAAYLDELDVDYRLPSTPLPRGHARASVSSLASVVTNASVDAVIPRSDRRSGSSANHIRRPSSLAEEPEDEPWSESESHYDQEDILDSYFCDMITTHTLTQQEYPETPTADEMMYRFSQRLPSRNTNTSSGYSDRRYSISSQSTSSSSDPTVLSIKAMHEDDIVILRLPYFTTLDDLRQKIYDKFAQTDKPTICKTFAIAVLEQPPAEMVTGGRPRAVSCSTGRSKRGVALHFVSSQDEWDEVVATRRDKIVLRIIGSRE